MSAGNARKCLRPIHEQLDAIACARRKRPCVGPPEGGRVQDAGVAGPAEATPVVGAHCALDAVADRAVDAVEREQTASSRPAAAAAAPVPAGC